MTKQAFNEEAIKDSIQLLKVKKGKYYVRFPKLETPIIMNEYFFNQIKNEVFNQLKNEVQNVEN